MISVGTRLLLGTALAGILALASFLVAPGVGTQATAKAGAHVSGTSVTPGSVSSLDVVTIKSTVTSDGITAEPLGVVMLVRDETGQTVLEERQTGISLVRQSDLSVYWEWRIPGRLAAGSYSVEMSLVDETGKVLATDTNTQAFRVTEAGR